MIHYSCDRCERQIESEEEFRYIVRLEVRPALDVAHDAEVDTDHEQLMELQELMESTSEVEDDAFHQMRFDLCPECYRKFIQNPVGIDTKRQFHFSRN